MGMNGNLGIPLSKVLQFGRPWSLVIPGIAGEMRMCEYSKVTYRWSEADSVWIAWGATAQDVTFHVDGVLGDDTASGDATHPLQTIAEAIARLPSEIRHDVIIDLADDSGAVYTYEEALVLQNFTIYPPAGRLRIQGKSVAATLASGPNVLAADPANTGDWRSLTIVPNPGWTARDLQGRVAVFTAGPHLAQEYCVILDNTDDTIFFGARPIGSEGQYGPDDAIEIRDISTVIRNTVPTGIPTLAVQNITAIQNYPGLVGDYSRCEMYLVYIMGEIANLWALDVNGPLNITMMGCVINGMVTSPGHCGGSLILDRSGILSYSTILDTILNDLYLHLDRTGLYAPILLAGIGAGGTHARLTNCVCVPNPQQSPRAVLTLDSVSVYMASCYIAGSKAGIVPVALRSRSQMVLDMPYGNIIESSAYSGIEGNLNEYIPGSGTGAVILGSYDSLPAGEFENDIRDNLAYGLRLQGQYRLIARTANTSTVPNGVGGCRLCWGGYYEFVGLVGSEPTISGPLGTDQVDFDDRDPIIWMPWDADATGPDTLCQMRQNPSVPH